MFEESYEVIERARERLELVDEPLRTRTKCRIQPFA